MYVFTMLAKSYSNNLNINKALKLLKFRNQSQPLDRRTVANVGQIQTNEQQQFIDINI